MVDVTVQGIVLNTVYTHLDYSWDEFPVYFGVFKSVGCFSCLLRCFSCLLRSFYVYLDAFHVYLDTFHLSRLIG